MDTITSTFFSWGTLATMAGAVAATVAITQLLKGVSVFDKIPTRIFAYIVALVLLLAATYFTGDLSIEAGSLCLINAVVVALAANGAYDAIPKK